MKTKTITKRTPTARRRTPTARKRSQTEAPEPKEEPAEELPEELPKREVIDTFFGVFRFLSNFHPAEVVYDGELYPTVEHAYQAAKTEDPRQRRLIAASATPEDAKRRGGMVTLRPGWDKIKPDIMGELLRFKFSDPQLAGLLLETGDALLVEENWWGDTYWGMVDGRGSNVLGNLLMEIREELRNELEEEQA